MFADNAMEVRIGLDFPRAFDMHLLRTILDADQRDMIEVGIVIFSFALPAFDPHIPFQHLLSGRMLRHQPQALQRIGNGLIEMIGGGVTDEYLHRRGCLLGSQFMIYPVKR